MPNPPFTVTPIPNRDDLIEYLRTTLRTSKTFAFDALCRTINDPELVHPWDALTNIHSDIEHALDVLDASKETS